MTEIKNHYNVTFLKRFGIGAIVFGSHIFYSMPEHEVTERLRVHEETHVAQYAQDGIVKFLLKYSIEYLTLRLRGKSHLDAYYNVSYELAARQAESEVH